MEELTFLQIENSKNQKFKKNSRTKKVDRDYYEYEDHKFYGLKM